MSRHYRLWDWLLTGAGVGMFLLGLVLLVGWGLVSFVLAAFSRRK